MQKFKIDPANGRMSSIILSATSLNWPHSIIRRCNSSKAGSKISGFFFSVVTVRVFYPLLLTVSRELSIHFHPWWWRVAETRGRIIFSPCIIMESFTFYALRCRGLFSSLGYLGMPIGRVDNHLGSTDFPR